MEFYAYNFAIGVDSNGEPVIVRKRVPKNDSAYVIAAEESVDGIVSIEIIEIAESPTTALHEQIAELEAALELILSGVTE